jgi:hypothetical protein
MQQNSRYAEIAKNNSFSYFFPSTFSSRTFSTVEEASDFINAAQIKLSHTTRKNPAKGLPGKLIGPSIKGDKPITVINILGASGTSADVDLEHTTKSLEENLTDAISVSCLFLVFTQDRGISLSKFLLKDGYQYTTNSQIEWYQVGGTKYQVTYPLGWTADAALKYLDTPEN